MNTDFIEMVTIAAYEAPERFVPEIFEHMKRMEVEQDGSILKEAVCCTGMAEVWWSIPWGVP